MFSEPPKRKKTDEIHIKHKQRPFKYSIDRNLSQSLHSERESQ